MLLVLEGDFDGWVEVFGKTHSMCMGIKREV